MMMVAFSTPAIFVNVLMLVSHLRSVLPSPTSQRSSAPSTMTTGPILRVSIVSSRHGAVDAELKALKLLSRRLQAALTSHATELQLLQRLYYKNKNQHRGSLFWRNVVEMRRYSERIENLSLSILLNGLRSSFHGSEAPNVNMMKGPWTHFPPEKYLANISRQFDTAQKIADKMSDVCLRAYQSFHCSLQSAAFLQLLLMFAAISSRMRAVAMELSKISLQVSFDVTSLLSFLQHNGNPQVTVDKTVSLPQRSLEAEDEEMKETATSCSMEMSDLPQTLVMPNNRQVRPTKGTR
ncbi:unnamed protein product [Cyclocybe aegerita]|uniref:Nucleolus and neural progenitor protein-like N-terminal domain-containing protein n=1 Tax=Cyclocybe aegerita TaxID=1973307 RepID=A0A8S0WUP8_CYCAE|nr:unnamed protein product [Cyclocybe aegerita]